MSEVNFVNSSCKEVYDKYVNANLETYSIEIHFLFLC